MDAQFVSGVESIEIGTVGNAPAFVELSEIEMGSVSWGVTAPTKTRFKAEDKPGTRVSLLGDQDPDTINFGTINLKAPNLKMLFGGRIDAATSIYYVPAETVIVKMQVRLTTRAVNGLKQIITFANCEATASFNGNFTRDGLLSVRVAADIIPYKVGEDEVKATIQTVKEDGTPYTE